MSKFQKIICLIIAIGMILSVTTTGLGALEVDSFLSSALEPDADVLDKLIYLEGQLRRIQNCSYEVYWKGTKNDMEEALPIISGDCDYLADILGDLYYEVHSIIYK